MTKYVKELTKDVMSILAKNCGRHYNPECKNQDREVTYAVEKAIEEAIHANLNNLFVYLTESAVIRARKQQMERNKNE
jgi:hypothetical protein